MTEQLSVRAHARARTHTSPPKFLRFGHCGARIPGLHSGSAWRKVLQSTSDVCPGHTEERRKVCLVVPESAQRILQIDLGF